VTFSDQLRKALNPTPDFAEFPQSAIDRMVEALWENEKALDYMRGRGFTDETLRKYEIGYSAKKDLVTVPMHTATGMPIGVIGRKPDSVDKQFKNSLRLPTSKTLFNIHRARRHGGTAIVTEASFDGMRVDQAGNPNVVSCLSGNVSPSHLEQLDKYFDTIIIMTDFDDKKKHIYSDCKKCAKRGFKLCIGHNPGRDLGNKIANGLPMKRVLWASYDERVVYPHGAKDTGDLEESEIRQCLYNAVTNFTYQDWGLY
jgi:5S rRNA maturation endonuclease (ribonuclease M5)